MAGSLKELFQGMAAAGMPGITTGKVTQEEPVTVTLEDDQKVTLSASSLIIPSAKAPLLKGEELYLLSVNNNKLFYVLDRK